MKAILLSLTLMFAVACPSAGTNTSNSEVLTRTDTKGPAEKAEYAVGDTVLHHSSSGQRFYEGKIVSLEGKKARVSYNDETVESDVSNLYPVPKAGEKKTPAAGDTVAARFGQTAVFPGAEVVKADGDKVTVKWFSTGKTEDVAPENVLALPPAAQERVKKSFSGGN